jgi:hypothetical protein
LRITVLEPVEIEKNLKIILVGYVRTSSRKMEMREMGQDVKRG